MPSSRLAAVLSSLSICVGLAACGGGGGGDGFAGLPVPPSNPSNPGADPGNEPPPAADTPKAPLVSCASLNGMSFTAAQIGLPTQGATVTSATAVAAADPGNAMGDYCRVRGAIRPVDASAPDIHFAVNLPQQWNQKGIQFGGGGFNGVLIDGTEPVRFGPADQPAPLAMGYATWGSDSGHQSSSITDAKFAANDEALANYGGQALKKTRDVAVLLVQATYGSAPRKAYFLGTSTGGRDALSYIQRWPADYDGVIANEPALNYSGTRLSNLAVGRALYANGGAGWVNLAKTLLVQKTVLAACDKLDGASDGIVSNVESCRQLNDSILASLRCPGGADTGNTCLSDPQLTTIRTIESPLDFAKYSLANGVRRAGGYNILEGTLVAGPFTTRDLGTRQIPGNPATSADANVYLTGDQWAKYFVTRNAQLDSLTFDPLDPGQYTERVQTVSALTDATDPDLRPFLSRGGRLILLHGLADEVISNNSTSDYYQRVVSTVGQAAADQGVRFYTVPGMGHGTGVFIPNWDSLGALENWVERGLAPATAVAADGVAGTFGRTRPLCLFPAWPKYKGSGSMDAAVNFSCTTEVGNPLACPNLPAVATTYKGGTTQGEEVQVLIDPTTMAYTVTVLPNASLQRSAGAQRSGTLVPKGQCSWASDESGALFTLGAGGVLQGGVTTAAGNAAAPLIAFQNTFTTSATDANAFRDVALIANAVGVQYGAGNAATAYAGSSRVRNAGTFQHCRDTAVGFNTYDANCASTVKGYLRYDSTRASFDAMVTSTTTGATPTTGGISMGSVIFGQVGAGVVPLWLVRESATSYGLRLFAPQASLVPGTADGHYATASPLGAAGEATIVGTRLDLGGAAGTLAYDNPVIGVVQSTGAAAGNAIYNAGLLAIVPPASGGANPLQLGVRN